MDYRTIISCVIAYIDGRCKGGSDEMKRLNNSNHIQEQLETYAYIAGKNDAFNEIKEVLLHNLERAEKIDVR